MCTKINWNQLQKYNFRFYKIKFPLVILWVLIQKAMSINVSISYVITWILF